MSKPVNRCRACHMAVGPSPGWHDCAGSAELLVERLETEVERLKRVVGLQAAALDVWKRAHPTEDGTRLAALAAAGEKHPCPCTHEHHSHDYCTGNNCTANAWKERALKTGEELVHWMRRAQEQDAELERLRAEKDRCKASWKDDADRIDRLEAEVERLKDYSHRLELAHDKVQDDRDQERGRRVSAEAEVARLRNLALELRRDPAHAECRAEVERLAKVIEALEADAAGVPVADLLDQVADYLRNGGGGPMEDRCRLAASAIRVALAAVKEKP